MKQKKPSKRLLLTLICTALSITSGILLYSIKDTFSMYTSSHIDSAKIRVASTDDIVSITATSKNPKRLTISKSSYINYSTLLSISVSGEASSYITLAKYSVELNPDSGSYIDINPKTGVVGDKDLVTGTIIVTGLNGFIKKEIPLKFEKSYFPEPVKTAPSPTPEQQNTQGETLPNTELSPQA